MKQAKLLLKLTNFQFEAPSGFTEALEITGSEDANININISGTNKLSCSSGTSITVASDINVDITGTSTDTLDVQGTTFGIGGAGNITISSGTISATAT